MDLWVLSRNVSTSGILLSLVISLLVILALFQRPNKKKYCFPPGPKGIPIFGVFFQIFDYPAYLAYTTWSKTFGGIFTTTVLGRQTVIINDVKTVREALINCSPKVDDRTNWRYCFIRLLRGLSVMPYSAKWFNTRRRTMVILREYGMGKSFLEPEVFEETQALIQNILRDSDDGKVNIVLKDRIRCAPVNILTKMLFSERYDYDDKKLHFILDNMECLLTYLRTASTYDCLPGLLRPVLGYGLQDFHARIEILHDFLASKVKHHEETYKDDVQRDFVDSWIKCQKRLHKKSSGGAGVEPNNNSVKTCNITPSDALRFDEESYSPVVNVLQDILVAGSHSTGYALNWLILLLIIRKEVQDRVFQAIIESIGPNGTPTTAARPQLPIVEAVIYETLRFSTLVPLTGHCCLDDVNLCGYTLPKGTEVTFNNWAVNHDERHFPNPNEFLPERWLKEDGSFDRQATANFFPFGLGKRSCAGEALAKSELFIMTTTLFQNLEFLMPDDSVSEKLRPEVTYFQSIVLETKPYAVRVRRRMPPGKTRENATV